MSEIVAQDVQTARQGIDLSRGFSSITATDLESRKLFYTAISDAKPLSDNLNKVINLKDVIVQPVSSEDEKTGVVEDYLRSVLIDADGTAYAASSTGVKSSLDNLFLVFGTPDTWDAPLAIKVTEKKSAKPGFKFFSITIA